jgi:hypothetical protein
MAMLGAGAVLGNGGKVLHGAVSFMLGKAIVRKLAV